eukprot:Awhi_evm1s14767
MPPSSRQFNEQFSGIVKKAEYKFTSIEPCLVISHDDTTVFGIYVDDGYKIGPDKEVIQCIEDKYPLKCLGRAECIVGMTTEEHDTHTKIHLAPFIEHKMRQLSIPIDTKVKTPLATDHGLDASGDRL